MKDCKYILRNGVAMPSVGFGTDRTFLFVRKNVIKGLINLVKDVTVGKKYYLNRDKSIVKIVKHGPENGCVLFDTASCYGQSERVLGYALKKYRREDVFLITKLSNEEQRDGDVEKALKRSLKHMRTNYVDLYLMHWPQTGTFIDSWKKMEVLYKKGYARAIGVCNFKQHHFEELFEKAEIKPMVCQIESHPLFNQDEMLQFCRENEIQMMAYTPTGRMDKRIRESDVLNAISSKHNKTVAQIIIRWHYQRNVIPIINTTNLEHLKENTNVFDFTLSEEEMKQINALNIDCRLRYDPDTVDFKKC